MYNLVSSHIDMSRIHFIPLESFEEVICNSEFILSKFPKLREPAINYKKHMNSTYNSTGSYFNSLIFNFIKQKPPIDTGKKRNIEQFYSKGMEYFKECFIDDCCSFEMESCKLQFEGNKKLAMLSNKFECYRIFISNTDEKE